MAAYFICLRKLSFYSDNAIKFITLFLKASLPGTVKPAPAKLCTVFLCTLLNRLRFSPQNVGFGTKNAPGSGLALSGAAAPALPKGEPNPLSHRCAMPAPPKGELNSLSQSLTALTAPSGREPLAKPETLRHSLKPSPWGRWLDAKRQDGRGSFPGSGLALSVIADAMPPLPKGEALAKPHTLQFNQKLYRHAKGSPFGRAVTKGD